MRKVEMRRYVGEPGGFTEPEAVGMCSEPRNNAGMDGSSTAIRSAAGADTVPVASAADETGAPDEEPPQQA